MIISTRTICALAFSLFSSFAYAQTDGRDFSRVDEYVKKLGPLDTLNMGTISSIVTKPFPEKIDKARAIFTWIALNISYDVKSARTGQTQKNSPVEVLKFRKAVGIGFASLFQDMCSAANIRCLTADGYIKRNTEEINESQPELNHSWAVVQLGLSPETWFYVDPAMGSGEMDGEMKTFTKSFNDAYFFSDKTIFNWQHYPDNTAWQLGAGQKNRKDFYALPLVKTAAHELGMRRFSPIEGKIKAKLAKPVAFNFTLDTKTEISSVTVIAGEPKKAKPKEARFSFDGNSLTFSHKFAEEGEYPMTILVNGKPLIAYIAVVEE